MYHRKNHRVHERQSGKSRHKIEFVYNRVNAIYVRMTRVWEADALTAQNRNELRRLDRRLRRRP